MKNLQLFEIFDGIDDNYIADALIKPAPKMAVGAFHVSSFFKSAASVAAIVLVLGMIFVWSIVGKDVLKAQKGDDTTQSTTPSQSVTTPLNQIITTPSDTLTTTVPQITTPQNTTTGEYFGPGITLSDLVVPADGIIKNENDLHAVLVKGKSNGNYTVTAKELDMSGRFWYGMADFSGTFDFGGCKIKNVQYSLFKSVKDGTIKNLVLTQSEFIYTSEMAKVDFNYKKNERGNIYYSPVVHYAKNITISNVVLESSVKIRTSIENDYPFIGGILGLGEGYAIRVENCEFHGTIENNSGTFTVGGIAGIAGGIMAGDYANLNSENNENSDTCVIQCVNTGSIRNFGLTSHTHKVAGVVGRLENGAAVYCSNSGKIFADGDSIIGGIAGFVYKAVAINTCINTGEISECAKYAGGIAGYSNGTLIRFINCINSGRVSTTVELPKSGFASGIVGQARGSETFTNCYNLSAATEAFVYNHSDSPIPVDLSDPSTFVNQENKALTFDNCGNYATVEEIFDKINTASPDTFTFDNGAIKLK